MKKEKQGFAGLQRGGWANYYAGADDALVCDTTTSLSAITYHVGPHD